MHPPRRQPDGRRDVRGDADRRKRARDDARADRPAHRAALGGARSGEPADDPALGGGAGRPQPRLHRSRLRGGVALRRDRRPSADATDLDHADAEDLGHRGARRLADGRSAEPADAARRGRLHRHAGDELRVRDRTLPPARGGHHLDDGARIDLRREADTSRARPLHHVGDDVPGRAGRGRRPADLPDIEVQARPGGVAEMSDRLAPTTTPDTKFFWDALKEGKLLIQRCSKCATLRHPPRPMCPRCNSFEWDTIESAGRGEVYSFVLPRHPPWPWFDGTYIVALVELE